MKVVFYISLGSVSALLEETFDTVEDLGLEDHPSEEKLNEAVESWVRNNCASGYYEVTE